MVTEFIKMRYHSGLVPNVFFWRPEKLSKNRRNCIELEKFSGNKRFQGFL